MKVTVVLIVFNTLFVGACSVIRPAQMALPENFLLSTEAIPIHDLGGGTRGSYRVGEYSGSFRRSESRLQFFDVLDLRSGSASFSLAGPLVEGQIEADCRMRERIINIGIVSFTPKRMAYGCDFTVNGRSFPARFEIQEAREGLAGALMKTERRGEVALDRVILQIHSVHDLEGSAFPLATPIGYVFRLDGEAVGAIELNGIPRLFLPRSDDIPLRRAVVTAAMALAVFWDPAASLL